MCSGLGAARATVQASVAITRVWKKRLIGNFSGAEARNSDGISPAKGRGLCIPWCTRNASGLKGPRHTPRLLRCATRLRQPQLNFRQIGAAQLAVERRQVGVPKRVPALHYRAKVAFRFRHGIHLGDIGSRIGSVDVPVECGYVAVDAIEGDLCRRWGSESAGLAHDVGELVLKRGD